MSRSSPNLESLIRVIDRQGLLKGDLDYSQRAALVWLMNQETEENYNIEKTRAQMNALGSNPATQQTLLKTLFSLDDESPQPESDEEFNEANIKWTTPQTEEELEELNRILNMR